MHPLPKVDILLAKLKNVKFFSKLDANSRFDKNMDKDSKYLKTFITHLADLCLKNYHFVSIVRQNIILNYSFNF